MESAEITGPLDSGQAARRVEAALAAARRRLDAGDAAGALLRIQGELTALPSGGRVAPDVFAELHLRLLRERSSALRALAQEVYYGPRASTSRPARRTARRARVLLLVPAAFTLLAGTAAALAGAAASPGLGPWFVAGGAACTVLVCLAVLAPDRAGTP